jgi:hypothetical protein
MKKEVCVWEKKNEKSWMGDNIVWFSQCGISSYPTPDWKICPSCHKKIRKKKGVIYK